MKENAEGTYKTKHAEATRLNYTTTTQTHRHTDTGTKTKTEPQKKEREVSCIESLRTGKFV